jgi:hypothetical protein
MSFLSRIFGSAPKRNSSTDAPAVAAVEPTAEELAAQLEYGEQLLQLAGLGAPSTAPASVRRAAQLQLGRLLEADPGLVTATLERAGSQSACAALAVESASPIIRRLAAAQVHEADLLAQLLKGARGHDNTVYRIAKERRDALHAREKQAAEALAAMQSLCATLERQVHQPWSEGYAAAVEHLSSQWRAISVSAPENLRARADTAIERCVTIVAQHQQQIAAEAARLAALEQATANQRALIADLQTLLGSLYAGTDIDAAATLASSTTRWESLQQIRLPSTDDARRFGQLRKAIAALIEWNTLHGNITTHSAAIDEAGAAALRAVLAHRPLLEGNDPPAVQEAAAALQAWDETQATAREAQANALRQMGGLLRKAQRALADGRSREAAGIRRSLDERLQKLGSVPASLAGPLETFDARLAELQDWRRFVAVPKRGELIAQMEALVGSDMPPGDLAEEIHRLQDEWRLVSQGSTEDTQAEWQRFHEASQKAYEPCREHFAALAAQRAANLEQRQTVLADLQQFISAMDPEQPDCRGWAQRLRNTRQAWQLLHPVDRAANKPLQTAFDDAMRTLQSRLESVYARHAEAKRALIARATSLAQQPDARAAAEEIKRLQADWQQTGPADRGTDQTLWQAFREQCDLVFAKRNEQQTELLTRANADREQAQALCTEAESLLEQPALEPGDALARITALQERFAALQDLPRGEIRGLRNRLERALDGVRARLAQQKAAELQRGREQLFVAAEAVHRLRLAVATGAPDDEIGSRRVAAAALLDSTRGWPRGTEQALRAALDSPPSTDLAANAGALRQLCIRAELLADRPTPDADMSLRREWQMQQLLKGLGQSRQQPGTAGQALLLEWLAAEPVPEDRYAELAGRFRACAEVLAPRRD